MSKNMDFNGMIHSKFTSESQMAQAMGWSRQRLNKITNGKKVPDLFDLKALADALGISLIDLVPIFLPNRSTTVDK